MKKPKQEKLSTIKNRLKRLVDFVVRTRDEGKCQKGGEPYCLKANKNGTVILHASHIFPVGQFPWMRYDPDNIKLLCYYHHFRWWHVSIIDAAEWIKTHLDPDRYECLKMKASNKVMMGREALNNIEANLLMEVDNIKESNILN